MLKRDRRTLTALTSASTLVLGLTCMNPAAQATLTIDSVVGGVPLGAASYVSFDDLPLGSGAGTSGGIAVSFGAQGQAVQGSVGGQYAAPFLSNNNGLLFGDPNNGPDATRYLSTGNTNVTLDLPAAEKYFGLLWGSVDTYNTLSFYDGATLVGMITGSDVTAAANGNQGEQGTYYVNINSTDVFNKVVASSTSYAFEFDNVAFNPTALTVPEPASMLLFGLGLCGLGIARRKRAI